MMHSLGTLAAVALAGAVLAGCGQQQSRPRSEAGGVGGCASDSFAVTHARQVPAAVDLDHDGVRDTLAVTAADADGCPNLLFAKVGGRYSALPLGTTSLALASAQRVRVPGVPGDVLAIDRVHSATGYQVHLFGYADGRLGEVTADGKPVLPLVATVGQGSGQGSLLSTGCADRAIVVRQAVAHTPPGVVFAWDIRETTYRLHGLSAVKTSDREIGDNVLPDDLGSHYPDLMRRAMFQRGCLPHP